MRDREVTEFGRLIKQSYKVQVLQFKQNTEALGLFAIEFLPKTVKLLLFGMCDRKLTGLSENQNADIKIKCFNRSPTLKL